MADAATAQFCEITGASPADARFYLEAAGGNVEAAISSFLEGGPPGGGGGAGGDDDMVVATRSQAAAPPPQARPDASLCVCVPPRAPLELLLQRLEPCAVAVAASFSAE